MRKKLIMLLTIAFILTSCTDAKWSKIKGYGKEFTVTKVSSYNGDTLNVWTSTGKVKSEKNSDGYYFLDKKTGHLIEVTGDIIIESK